MSTALTILALVFATAIALGLLARRGRTMTLDEWSVGGRRFGSLFVFLLMAGEIYTTFTFLGGSGWAYGRGAPAMYILCYLTLAYSLSYFLLPAIWRASRGQGFVSQADFFAARYDSTILGVLVAVVGVAALVPYLVLQLEGLGIIVSEASYGTIRPAAAIWAGTAALIGYVVVSGVRGSAWTAALKDTMILVVVVAMGVYLPLHFYGGTGAMFQAIDRAKPGFLTLSGAGRSPTWFISTVLLTSVGVYVWPQLFAGVYTARSDAVFRKNAAVLPLYQLVVLFVFFIGFAATLVVPGLVGASGDLSLFRIAKLTFAPWTIGLIGGAGLLTALVPGSVLLITAATILAKNVYRVAVPTASDRRVAIVARAMVPVLALVALFFALHGGQGIVVLLLMGYNVVTQLFPALLLSFGPRPRVRALAAIAGILAGEITVGAITLSGSSAGTLIPGLPRVLWDLNVGVVALAVNVLVVALVSLVARRPSTPQVPLVSSSPAMSPRVTTSQIASLVLGALLLAHPLFAQGSTPAPPSSSTVPSYVAHVEVRRTTHGVPHIRADNLAAAEYALAYVQSEDYGARVPLDLLRARGEMGRWFGRDSMEHDFAARLAYDRAVQSYPFIDRDTRDVYEGFAAGANRYVELHPEEFPAGFAPHFTGYDVLAHDVSVATAAEAARFLARHDPDYHPRRRGQPAAASSSEGMPPSGSWVDTPDEGSNAWAFGPSRTRSGHAILLRNPHLQWNAGYYEAHITVPGVLDFYGDFRIGGPFGVIGGFNRDLGWATTNNDPLLGQIYALALDSARGDRYRLDGTSHEIQRESVTVAYRDGDTLRTETREVPRTPFGPVVYRDSTTLYVLRAAMDGDFRAGEQFLRMMRAHSLAEWKDAMRMRARLNSSFTYADRAGHIYYVWNAAIPSLPQGNGSDTAAVPATGVADMWMHYVPFDSLPQVLDPRGGYIHNENDPPYYTNMHQPLDPAHYPAYFPEPKLGLRSQMALQLIDTDRKLSLKDVIALKYSYHMLLADRVRDDLVAAVRASHPAPDVAQAIDMIARWDRTVAPGSRGGVLFEIWWRRYIAGTKPDTMYAVPWSAQAPTSTPRGIRDPARAVDAFAWAVQETTRRYGRADVTWGDVHRVRIGSVDVPVGGCNGDIGCFRVLWYKDDPDGKREAVGGDGWILAVEFGTEPRAYSVLAYGESPNPDSPFHSDQAEMFARGQLKPVAWSEAQIEQSTVRRYRPGERR